LFEYMKAIVKRMLADDLRKDKEIDAGENVKCG
jgi:hypothetical protein